LSGSNYKKDKILILFSYFYPYSDFDNYINEEIKISAKAFSKIYIIPIHYSNELYRKIPDNAILVNYPIDISKSTTLDKLKVLFSRDFFDELKNIFFKRKIKISLLLIKTIVVYLLKVFKYKEKLETIIENEIETEQKDIFIYSYWMLENAVASGLVKKKYPNIKAFSRAHSADIYFERNELNYIPFSDKVYQILDAIYFISEMGKNYFVKTHHLPQKNRLQVARLGTIEALAIPSTTPNDVIKIISLSWILPFKRIELIADALQKITDIKIHWVHIGAYYPERFEAFKKYTKDKLSLNTNITYDLKGDMKNDEISTYFAKEFFDVFISTSATEGIPVSMMESMSYGIPVISTNVGGVNEIVEDSYNGFLLDANPTADSVAEKIKAFCMLSEVEKQNFRKNAIERWDTRYNAKKNYTQFVNDFCQL
jgi:colanic acid/amylovoran biosynthesis glycosyltransferase